MANLFMSLYTNNTEIDNWFTQGQLPKAKTASLLVIVINSMLRSLGSG